MSIRSLPIVAASVVALMSAPAFASAADAQKLPPCVKGQPIPPGGCRNVDPSLPPGTALGELRPAPPLNAPDAPVPIAPAPPLNAPGTPIPVQPAPPLTVPDTVVPPSVTPRAPSVTPRAPSTSPSVVTPPPTGDTDISRKPPPTGDRIQVPPPPNAPAAK